MRKGHTNKCWMRPFFGVANDQYNDTPVVRMTVHSPLIATAAI
ncbi:hypothetical protein MHI01_27485 [Paenibacillus sp. FSL M7-0656]